MKMNVNEEDSNNDVLVARCKPDPRQFMPNSWDQADQL